MLSRVLKLSHRLARTYQVESVWCCHQPHRRRPVTAEPRHETCALCHYPHTQ